MAESIIIDVKNISKSYFSNKVLHNISLQMQEGKFYALLGENGTGKSTLLRILMGVEKADTGEGTVCGVPLLGGDQKIKERIGFVSENIEFDVPINMKEFMSIYRESYPSWDEAFFQKTVQDRKIDLNKKFRNYSRGQKMQLALIAALSICPKVIFIDEITSVLDLYARKYFMSLLNELVLKGGTVVLTTNIISEVQFFASDLVLLSKGTVQLNSPIRDVPDNFTKLRRLKDIEHPVFQDEKCFWAGINSDFSTSYIIPKELQIKYQVPPEFIDKRNVQLDDIFIYYYNYKVETVHETAA